MIKIGLVCVKLAGREAGKKCVIVEIIDDSFVTIDGQVKRKRCNIRHLEPLKDVVKIKDKASTADVAAELKKLGIEVTTSKTKPKTDRPKKVRRVKEKAPKKEKKAVKKEEPKKPAAKKATANGKKAPMKKTDSKK
ncbi:MAG: 50S ribosomal protein L14e [bacterium]|nr:50S ribosomal protein L14e [bacterium]